MSSFVGGFSVTSTPGSGAANFLQYDGMSGYNLRAPVGADIPVATSTTQGAMTAANWKNVNNYFGQAILNALDYGADPTGATDIVASVLPAMQLATSAAFGARWVFPPGTYKMASAFTITVQGVTIEGANWAATTFSSSSATADMFVVNNWYTEFTRLMWTNSVAKTAGYCINAPSGYDYCDVNRCFFQGASGSSLFRGINMGNLIMTIRDCRMINVSDAYVVVTAASNANQFIENLLCSNPAQCTTGGIVVQSTGSLTLSNLDIVNGGPGALYIQPATGVTIPSVKCVNSFFDTSTNGLQVNCAGTGTFLRSTFTNCWFGSATGSGVLFQAAGGGIDGITFNACEFYGNGIGMNFNTAVNDVACLGGRFAGSTTSHFNIAAQGASTFIDLESNMCGPIAAFTTNTPVAVQIAAQATSGTTIRMIGNAFRSSSVSTGTTGVNVAASTHGTIVMKGNTITGWATGTAVAASTLESLRIEGNAYVGNTTALTRGAITISSANYTLYRVVDNDGLNPLQPLAAPTLAATTAATVNNTGLRCIVTWSAIGTGATRTAINGVTTGAMVALLGAPLAVVEPGGSVTIAYTAAPTLAWIGN